MVPLLNERLKYYPFYLCPNKFGASNLEQRIFSKNRFHLGEEKFFCRLLSLLKS